MILDHGLRFDFLVTFLYKYYYINQIDGVALLSVRLLCFRWKKTTAPEERMSMTNPKVMRKMNAVVESFFSGRYMANPTTARVKPMKTDAIATLH